MEQQLGVAAKDIRPGEFVQLPVANSGAARIITMAIERTTRTTANWVKDGMVVVSDVVELHGWTDEHTERRTIRADPSERFLLRHMD